MRNYWLGYLFILFWKDYQLSWYHRDNIDDPVMFNGIERDDCKINKTFNKLDVLKMRLNDIGNKIFMYHNNTLMLSTNVPNNCPIKYVISFDKSSKLEIK